MAAGSKVLVQPLRFNLREIAGSLGDIGTLFPLAAVLVTVNGLNPTVVFGIFGLVYILSGLYYRVPMAVQPLKSFSSLAIALCLGSTVIGAGAILMGACMLALGACGVADWLAQRVPRALVRGIQLGVGVILIRVGMRLSFMPVASSGIWLSAALAAGTGVAILLFAGSRRFPAGLLVVAGGVLTGLLMCGTPHISWGPVVPDVVRFSARDFWTAAMFLVLPQLPLTLTNSLAATRDVARSYYGSAACRVTGRALAIGMGVANIAAGVLGGMPVCHGSGGMTAHYRFGARTGGAGVFIGVVLLVLALCLGSSMAGLCALIPLPLFGALLVYVGTSHCFLIRDVSGWWDWIIVLATGGIGGIMNHNGYGLAAGLVLLAIRLSTRKTACQAAKTVA